MNIQDKYVYTKAYVEATQNMTLQTVDVAIAATEKALEGVRTTLSSTEAVLAGYKQSRDEKLAPTLQVEEEPALKALHNLRKRK